MVDHPCDTRNVANQHKHPLRGVRGVPDADWADFADAAKTAGADRSAVLAEFIRWYIHRDGAQPPTRPHDTRSDDDSAS